MLIVPRYNDIILLLRWHTVINIGFHFIYVLMYVLIVLFIL